MSSEVGRFLRVGVRIMLGLVVIGAPPLLLTAWLWPQGLAVVGFGAIVAILGAIGRGFASGVKFAAIFAVAAVLASWVTDSPVLAALLVAGMSALIAVFATKGLGGPMSLAALLTPYVIHSPASRVLDDGTTLSEPLYLLATFVALLAAGAYAAFVTVRLIPAPKQSNTPQVATLGQAIVYGTVLATTTGLITLVAMTAYRADLWMWLLMTVYILTKPTLDLDYRMIRDRLIGTVVGTLSAVILVTVIQVQVFFLLGFLLITVALVLKVEKKSYWIYASFITPAVIFFDSAANDRVAVADQRLLFTLIGVFVALLIGVGMNLLVRWYAHHEAKHADSIALADSPAQ